MPDNPDDALISAIERFKKGEETKDDRKIIEQAFASKQIEIPSAEDSKAIQQTGGANFGESNEIRVSGPVIGTQSISGFSAEQVLELLKLYESSRNEIATEEIEKIKRKTRTRRNYIVTASAVIIIIIVVAIFWDPILAVIFRNGTETPTPEPSTAVAVITTTTPTPTPTNTPSPTDTHTPTLTNTPTPTDTYTPTPTDTHTPTPTNTQVVFFEDRFKDYSEGWDLATIKIVDEDGNVKYYYYRDIIGGIFTHQMECERKEGCRSNNLIPSDNSFGNFDLSFDVKYENISTGSYPYICVFIRKIREENKDSFYHICFGSSGQYKFIRTLKGNARDIPHTPGNSSVYITDWSPGIDLEEEFNSLQKNNIRITAVNEIITLEANGVKLDDFEDGSISTPGRIEIVIFNKDKENLNLYIDNLVILEPEEQ